MSSNKSWVEKADLEVQNFIDSGGYLNAEQTKELFFVAINGSVLLQLATTKTFAGPSFEISKLGFSGRVLRAATENVALGVNDRVKPTPGKTTLTTSEFIAEARIPYAALEDHVAQGGLMDAIRSELGKALSRDIEWIGVNGDTTSTDLALKKFDGLIAQISSYSVSAGEIRLSKSVMKLLAQTMPSQYYRSAQQLAYLTSKNAMIDYGDSLASRQTGLGDSTLLSANRLEYNGAGIVSIPEFPENLGTHTDETVVILCDPKNATFGFQRQVLIETDKDISARQYIVVATVRFTAKWIHEPAVAMATGVLASASA